MRVIVIGGGAVGLSVAEALVSRGVEVTVLERDRCGLGASAGNAGWITPSLSEPVPGPGVVASSLRSLLRPSAPLWIRPTLDPAMLAWIARFISSCGRAAHWQGLIALQRAGALAGPAFDRLASRGVRFELHDDPLLMPAFDRAELEHLLKFAAEVRAVGVLDPPERLSAEEVRALEPALSPSVVGGLIAHGERRVRPELLCAGLRSALRDRGAEVVEHAPVSDLRRDGSTWLVHHATDSRRGDAVVIAGGVATRELLAPLGVRIPLVAAKGYSRTYELDPSGPRGAVYLDGAKVAISAFEEGARIAGTLELGTDALSLSRRRLEAITAAARRALPGWQMPPASQDWAGMRPLSPDGLPYVGPVPGLEGLHLATAHGMLGITLAPATGELLADLLVDGRLDDLLRAFAPARAAQKGTSSKGGPR